VVAPRFLAALISMPLLAAIFSAVGVLGGYFVGVGLPGRGRWRVLVADAGQVDLYEDIMNGVIKTIVFGWWWLDRRVRGL